MTKSKPFEEGIKSFEQLGVEGGELVKNTEVNHEKQDVLPDLELEKVNLTRLDKALKELKSKLSNNSEFLGDSRKYFDLHKVEVALESILGFLKKKSIVRPSSESFELWNEFEEGKGLAFEALNSKEKPEKKENLGFSRGQIVKIKNELGEMEDSWVFQEIRNNNIAIVTKKGLHGTRLKNVSLKEFEKWNDENNVEHKTEKTEEKAAIVPEIKNQEPKPEPKKEKEIAEKVEEKPIEFSSEIKSKLASVGISPEALQGIKDFDKISNSEGKILSVIEKISQIKLKTVEADAEAYHEKYVREGKGFFQKLGRSFSKKGTIQLRKYKYENLPVDVERHGTDIEAIIHLADIGPDISVKKDIRNGEKKLVNEYLGVQEGIDPIIVEAFNESSTEYSKLPPKYEWYKFPKKVKEFEKIEAKYQNKKDEVLNSGISMRLINDAEFNIKISQTLNHHPEVELELKKLAETKGWRRDWESLKAQVLPGSAGFGMGLVTRLGTKSAMASVFGAAAIPFTVIGLGAGFGYSRGWKKGEKNLRKEEELLRMGSENHTASSRKINALIAQRSGLTNPKDIEVINKKITELRKKSTDDNFVKAEGLVSKIDDLTKKVSLKYEDYLKDAKGKTLSLEEFNAKKEEWVEQLEVRVEFTKKKLDEGEISFGKDEKALSNKYNLIQKMGEAITAVDTNPRIDEKEIVNKYGHTRRSKLEKLLISTEMRIDKNKKQYVRDQAAIGALTGGLMAGAGYQVGHIVSEAFGSHAVHAVHVEAQALKASGKIVAAQHLEKATEEGVKVSLVHKNVETLINHDVSSVKVETPIEHIEKVKPFDFELKNETQSREYALVKYYESKGLSRHDAGTKANLRIKEIFGTKGERATSFVHKGDHIVITEENGKPNVEVVSSKHVHVKTPEHSTPVENNVHSKEIASSDADVENFEPVKEVIPTPNQHPVAQHLEKAPEKFGFKGDVKNPAEVKAWSHKTMVDFLNKNPHLRGIASEHVKEVSPTVTGGVHVETHPESIPDLMAHYEVKTATSLSAVSENLLSKDPRWVNLNGEERDRVLYGLFVKQFIGHGHDAGFYKGMGIKSGNPFDIKPGTLKLSSLGGKSEIDKAFASAHDSSLGIAKGFRNKIGTLIQKTKDFDAEDIFEENIVEILKKK